MYVRTDGQHKSYVDVAKKKKGWMMIIRDNMILIG